MPLIIVGVLAVGIGAKLAGSAVDDAGSGSLKLAGAAVLAAGAYYMVKK